MLKEKPDGRNIALTFDDGYTDNFIQLLPYLNSHQLHATLFIGPKLCLNPISFSEKIDLRLKNLDIGNERDLADWIKDGMGVGFHSCTHLDYSLLSEIEVEDDLIKGTELFEQLTGFKPLFFAFPFGNIPHNFSHYQGVASRVGLRFSLTVNWGDVSNSPSDFLINRICIGDNDYVIWAFFKSVGFLDWYYYMRKIKNEQKIPII